MKTYKNLWNVFLSEDNIDEAIRNVCKHKTMRLKFKDLHDHPEKYKKWILHEAENYKNSKHRPLVIYDGIQRKKRTIIVPRFREQIIHHMVVNILKPIIMKSLYEHSYGSVPGRGAHLAKKYIKKAISKGGKNIKYVLKMDVKKYFDSIPHDKLEELYRKKIKDEKFIGILLEITSVVDKGIPLGFYTSQWIANWYLSDLDHFIKEQLHAVCYYRYMDDMVIFGSNKRELHKMRLEIVKELKKLGLEMKENWQVFRFENDGKYRFLDFMGFRFYRNRITLRRSIYFKACRKAKRVGKKWKPSIYEIRQVLSYLGWISATNTYGAFKKRISPYINVRKMKKRISNYDKRERRNNEISESTRNTGDEAA